MRRRLIASGGDGYALEHASSATSLAPASRLVAVNRERVRRVRLQLHRVDAAVGGRFHEILRLLEGLVVIARDFGDHERGRAGANATPVDEEVIVAIVHAVSSLGSSLTLTYT